MSEIAAPVVSVCIPAFRGAPHIAAAIESVLQQSHADFELVIIDDNSSDETVAIVQRYRDPRIRLLRNRGNLGPQGNWNRCLDEARGTYVKLLPQDDLLAADCLARQVAILDQDSLQRIALVFCSRTIVDHAGRPITTRSYSRAGTGCIASEKLIRHCLRRGTNLIGEPGSVMFRRQLAISVGRFDASIPYVLDLDYWFRLLLEGDAYYIAEDLASFRVSSGSWSVAIGTRQRVDFRRFIKKIAENKAFSTRYIDAMSGNIMADINNCMRLIFYRLMLK
jgi:glycosyltransferase involved in cell wall biosynthesis